MGNTQNGSASQNLNNSLLDLIEKKLPENLRLFRTMAGLTTSDVGLAVNKTPSTVTMWEKGKALPDIGTLFKLRNLYKRADLNEFFDESQAPSLKLLTSSEQELIKLWRNSKPHIRASIKTLLKECNNTSEVS